MYFIFFFLIWNSLKVWQSDKGTQ